MPFLVVRGKGSPGAFPGKLQLIVGSSFGLLGLLVIRLFIGNFGSLVDAMAGIHPSFFLLSLLVAGAALFFDSLRLGALLRAVRLPVTPIQSFRLIMAGTCLANITPFLFGGAPAQAYLLARSGYSTGRVGAALVGGGVIAHGLLALGGPVGMLIGRPGLERLGFPWEEVMTGVGVYAALVLIITCLGLAWSRSRSATRSRRETPPRPASARGLVRRAGIRESLRREAGEFAGGVREIRAHWAERPSLFWYTLLYTGLYYACIFGLGPILLAALTGGKISGEQSVLAAVLFYTGALAAFAVPTPGGSGGPEAAVLFLGDESFPLGILAALALLWRFLVFYLPTLFGWFCLAGLLKSTDTPRGARFSLRSFFSPARRDDAQR